MKIFFAILAISAMVAITVLIIVDYFRFLRKNRSSRVSDKAVSDRSINSERPGNDK